MQTKFLSNSGLLLLTMVFSTGLMFAFIELPVLLDNLLQTRMGFPQFDHGVGSLNALKTEMFVQGLHLRWIGYASLFIILGLIIFGYTTRKSGWALAGAIGIFLPVFGQFALSMFFLAGLGFLRVGWLPFLEVSSIDILDLGKVIFVPYWILMWFFGLFKWNAHSFLTYFFMGSGAFLFTWGVLLWFKTKYSKMNVVTSRIYRFSRHPQYLGWIIWSYGFILFTPFLNTMKMSWSVSSSLPWLLMTMTIIGICMMEELKMMQVGDGKYQEYRKLSPFLFPLPRLLKQIITWPARIISKGKYPSSRSQVVWITVLYTIILMLLSLFWVDLRKDQPGVDNSQESLVALSDLMEDIRTHGDDRRGIWILTNKVVQYGPVGLDSLLELATDKNPIVREFSMQLLGDHGVKRVENILLVNMYDSTKRVRSSAIQTAGKIRSELAVDTLVQMITNPRMPNNIFIIYEALGAIGDWKAIPCLASGLKEGPFYDQISALNALMKIDQAAGLEYAMEELKDEDVKVRRNAVIVCILSESPAVLVPLKAMYDDDDFEVRFYARQGVKRIENM